MAQTRRTRIYVAGPMTSSGGPYDNIHKGMKAGVELLDAGYAPFVPHLTSLLEMYAGQRTYEQWLGLDRAFLLTCEGLLRLPGMSRGADEEVALAKEAGIPVFYSVAEVLAALPATQYWGKR